MKRITVLTMLLACGLLAMSTQALAQTTAPSSQTAQAPTPADTQKPADTPKPAETPNWFNGNVNLLLLGRDDVASSRFEEYRRVPKGVSMPVFSLAGSQDGNGFALFGKSISQK